MRGNELLDHMELVDPAYIEEADTMPKKKRISRRTAVAACLAAVMLVCGVILGVALSDPAVTPPEDVPTAQIDWTMYSVWVDEQGNVPEGQQPLAFSVKCAVYGNGSPNSAAELEYSYTFPKDFRYTIEMPSNMLAPAYGPKMTGYPYYITSGYQYDFEESGYDYCYWAISLEKEWMIFEWEYLDGSKKDPGRYLIASRDPNADPKEILAYFQGFLDSYSPTGPHVVPPGIVDYVDELRKCIQQGRAYPHVIHPADQT